MKVVIIGNGIAGVNCAAELRKREADRSRLSIEIYGRESFHYYSRIKLPELLMPSSTAANIILHDPSWYSSRGIDIYLGEEAIGIDRDAQVVRFSSGHVAHYDRLVLALGSRGIRPQFPGSELSGTFVLREINDALRLFSYTRMRSDSAVVLGGGLLGLEAAKHLADSGVRRVEVVEFFDRLLPRQLDHTGSELLERRLTDMGISFRVNAAARSIAGKDRVEGLELKDGSFIPSAAILFSVGVRSRVELAEAAGIALGKGIAVDEHLRSSDPIIYAVGDAAEFEGIVWGNLPAALEQAPCAAAHILGDESRPYVQTIPRATLKVAGIDVSSFGAVRDDSPGMPYVRVSADGSRYEKYVLSSEGNLTGAILIGSRERARTMPARLGKPISQNEIDSLLSF